MARTVNRIDVIGEQAFNVQIFGLNVGTRLNVYFDNQKISSNNIEPRSGKRGDQLESNFNGEVEFIFYFTEQVATLNQSPEAVFMDYLTREASAKTLIVVDKASIDASSLPDNYRTVARCYAETSIEKAYTVTFTEVKDWGHVTETQAPIIRNYE